ncbi:hypothetical protein BDP27DRAFT_1225111 [Rhodocollybia butyracea]|uniref:Cytochrome b561 domain-containing protein n=1 Tax=Rhodocollybia butyracea TaxID=206335 RepID=A0A9P5U6G6_9AGAR|nr:hypothetical protein BDP27DRAFT_1225111 [Rhodocollybia butyracea]
MSTFPLTFLEVQAKNHALLSTIGFLILLPFGVLVARYARTFTPVWFPVHAAFQLLFSGPVIFAGWYYGHRTATLMGLPHFNDPHEKTGLALLILYVIQLVLGLFTHFVKLPSPFGAGTRSPQNYFHVFLGLVILVVAAEQVHRGLYIEWIIGTGNLHPIPDSAKKAWLALVVVRDAYDKCFVMYH